MKKSTPRRLSCRTCGVRYAVPPHRLDGSCPTRGACALVCATCAALPPPPVPRLADLLERLELNPEEVAEGARELSWRHPEARGGRS